MAHEIRTDDPRGFNKGRSSTYAEHPAVPEFDKHLKKAGGHVEDNSPKNLSEWHKSLKEGFNKPDLHRSSVYYSNDRKTASHEKRQC